jgi:hypothetical protein
MTNCDDVREHLEACDDCRLHVAVEARLRTQPVLEPPRNLVDRVLKSLPRPASIRREVFRLAAAAAVLFAVASGIFLAKLDRHESVVSVKEKTARGVAAAWSTLSSWRNTP